jgi:hypothetical protein
MEILWLGEVCSALTPGEVCSALTSGCGCSSRAAAVYDDNILSDRVAGGCQGNFEILEHLGRE